MTIIDIVGPSKFRFPVGSVNRSFICVGAGYHGSNDSSDGGGGGAYAVKQVNNDEVDYDLLVDDDTAEYGSTSVMRDEATICRAASAFENAGGQVNDSIGAVRYAGGMGGSGSATAGGGGGSAAHYFGPGSDGGDADGDVPGLGGVGESPVFGSGGNGSGPFGEGNGGAGYRFGGGGGGRCLSIGDTQGGAGTSGVIVARYAI